MLSRFKKEDEVFYYTGLQIINLSVINKFNFDSFSFNIVWDYLIKKNLLCGNISKSKLFHVGDIHGLNIVKNLKP